MTKINIKRGALVEFTNNWYQSYPPKDESVIKFGICLEDTDKHRDIKVRTVKGVEIAHFIHAHSWVGWMPEDLEKIYLEEFGEPDVDMDY